MDREALKLETVALGKQGAHMLEQTRQLHAELFTFILDLEARINQSVVDAPDSELGYHELWISQVEELIDQLQKKIGQVKERSARRTFNILMSRESEGFIAFDHKVRIDGDLLPTIPKKDSQEYVDFMTWMKASEYASLVQEQVAWPSLRKLCNELAEEGKPPPPGIKLSPKPKVKLSKV